ncbi:Major facilitator superfamily domain-containing protein 6 [Holothuria leucospilota]|uniref:Major facilitator superfamily domain-containing protein 6 n=1 Tax=Holothuria leucospilota TaxID=206669 RepID=A0A9Q1C5I9_HOLLE|nr:Major facilitator superfamily domain-containing protein 6 [Holothuria leucospilota]
MGVKWHSLFENVNEKTSLNLRRNRILTAYTEFIETLEEGPEAKNDEGNLLDHVDEFDEFDDRHADRWYNRGCCGRIVQCLRCCWAVDETTLPFKLLYIFTRGGYAAISTFLVVYFTQIGISPTDVGKIQFLPHVITAIVTSLVGFISDRFLGNILLLLLAVTLWCGLTLSITLVGPPNFADCLTALSQLSRTIDNPDRIPGVAEQICAQGPINFTLEETHHWSGILRIPVTRWSSVLETCYPGAHFVSVTNQDVSDSAKVPSYGVIFTSSQQMEMTRGWMYGDHSLHQTFMTVFLLVAAGTLMQQVMLTLIDGVTLSKLGSQRRHEYGLQSSTGTAGFAVCAVVIAYVLHITEAHKYICQIPITVQDYYPAMVFHIVASCCSLALVLALCFSRCQTDEQKNSFNPGDLLVIFRRGSFLPIVVTAFFLSICEGLVQPFLTWHIQYIGGTTTTVSWSIVAMGFSELFMAFTTGRLILRFGYSPLLCVGVGVYFVRFLVYALLSNTATVYAAEVLHGISTALTWNVIVAYLSGAVPRECQTFLQGVLRGLCFGLGEGFGILIAGYFIDAQGTFNTFYLYSLFCLTGCFVLVIYQTSRAALPVSNGEAHHPAEAPEGAPAGAAAAAAAAH